MAGVNQSRREFIQSLSAGAAAISITGFAGCVNSGKRPNFVFILVDDMGWNDAGFMGRTFYDTPHIDRLASEGMIFTSAYANAPNCAPSRASLLTGMYTPRHGIYTVSPSARGKSKNRKLIPIENRADLDTEFITIAEVLKDHNYITASMGKWHLGDDPESGPTAQGFDINIGGYHKGHPKSYFSPYQNPAMKDGPEGEYLTDRLTEEAVQCIRDNRGKPFFLYLPHYAVHTPLQAKQDMIEKYQKRDPDGGQKNAKYAAMLESTDQGVGRIMETLKETGLDENTVVIFFSDNGGLKSVTDNSPLRGGKGMMYEGGIRVPMIVRWPGKIASNKKCDNPVIGTDFFPTMLEMAGIKLPSNLEPDGISFVQLLKGTKRLNQEPLFWHFPAYLEGNGKSAIGARNSHFRTRPAGAVRKGDWKLIEFFEDNGLELYNLREDISESQNLATALPEKANELHEIMRNWRTRVEAPVPTELNSDFIEK